MANLLLLKLIIMGIALFPAGKNSGLLEIIDAEHGHSPVTVHVKGDVVADRYGENQYNLMFAGPDNVPKDKMTIHIVDNGLYQIVLSGKDSFEVDLAPYLIEMDPQKFKGSGQILQMEGGDSIRIRREGSVLRVSSPGAEGLAVIVPESNKDLTMVDGIVPVDVYQHPITTSPVGNEIQGYLNLKGENSRQILLIFTGGMKQPKTNRRIQVAGVDGEYDLGGKPGTRGSYKNRRIVVKYWIYLDSKGKK